MNIKFDKKIIDCAKFFRTISNPTRLQILVLFENKQLCVNEITSILNIEQSAISHQLAFLKKYHFVKSIKKGRTVYYQLYCNHINELINVAIDHINKHN